MPQRRTPRFWSGTVLAFAILGTLTVSPGAAVEPSPYQRFESHYEFLFHDHMERFEAVDWGEVEPHWITGDRFWFVEDRGDRLAYVVDARTGERRELFDLQRLMAALEPWATDLGHADGGLPFDRFEVLDRGNQVRIELGSRILLLRLSDYRVSELPRDEVAQLQQARPRLVREAPRSLYPQVYEQLAPDGSALLGESEGNLTLREPEEASARLLTTDGAKMFAWDSQSARWSPDSRQLAVLKVDQTHVHQVPVVHWLKVQEEVELISMPKAGGALPRRELYLFDMADRSRERVDLGDTRNVHLFPLQWSLDGSEFFLLRVDRAYRRLELLAIDASTGTVRPVLEETSDTFIGALRLVTELQHRMFFPLADGERFLWLSERDGWYHIYLYDLKGKLLRQLTHGRWPVRQVEAIDEDSGWVYFTAGDDQRRPYDRHLFRIRLTGGKRDRLTEAPGEHHVSLSPSLEYFVDTHSTIARPPRTELRRTDGSLVTVLSRSDLSPLIDAGWQPPEEFRVTSADGETELFGVLIKPYPFDPERQYPVIDYIYNGPFITWVPRHFNEPRLHHTQALARLGFVVFLVDGRGTPGRGKTFQDVVYRNFGRHEIPDHVSTLRELASTRPYMDLDRVGIYGGSWGGYMAIRALLMEPDVFHVGVATNSLVDLYDHEATGIEGYMGLVAENRAGYDFASNLRLADRLRGHLLLIHSTSDVNVTLSTTMKMVEALIRAERPFDLLLLPEEEHIPQGTSRSYWLKAHRRYFVDHLRPTPEW